MSANPLYLLFNSLKGLSIDSFLLKRLKEKDRKIDRKQNYYYYYYFYNPKVICIQHSLNRKGLMEHSLNRKGLMEHPLHVLANSSNDKEQQYNTYSSCTDLRD
jgi:hypothetical protein